MSVVGYKTPRDKRGKFLSNKVVGYPFGLHDWMHYNERRAQHAQRTRQQQIERIVADAKRAFRAIRGLANWGSSHGTA